MRRSAAPSQTQNVKRRKTCEERPSNVDDRHILHSIYTGPGDEKQPCNKENESVKPSNFVKYKPRQSSFRTPVWSSPSNQQGHKTEKQSFNETFEYYSVMWGKMSKKKHKTWDGDGILVTKDRTAILQDLDGKEIAKGQGYKAEELATFSEEQTLYVGGKQVEIVSEISKEVYLSGRCFQRTSVCQLESVAQPKKSVLVKPFSNPQKSVISSKTNTSERTASTVAPRYDPNGPGALVMPKPGASHQWEHNKKHAAVVDVVVDPHIASVLRPHQREGVAFLYECVTGMRSFSGNGAILADDMGLGKTLQCIALVWTLHKQGMYGGQPNVKRILIITPGSLVKNWAAEFRKWLGNERMPVYTVNSEKKVKEFMHSPVYPAMVISYEMFLRYVEDIRVIKFDLVICDEAHRLKNAAIKTTTLIASLNIQRKVLLTGTPIQNDLTEFFSLAEFCNPGIFGSQASFRRVYEEPITHGRQPDANAEEKLLGERRANELNRLTGQFLLRRTSVINNKYLPSKVESVVFCRASDLQLTLYRHLISSRWFRSCFAASYAGSLHLMCIAALKKLCNHPSLLYKMSDDGDNYEDPPSDREETLYDDIQMLYPADYDHNIIEYSGKLTVLGNLLRNIRRDTPSEKVVVVSNYTQTLDIIQHLCESSHYQFLRLDGQTPTGQRQNLVERFNRKGSRDFVFLLSSKAGGVGLNLTGGSILILFDIDWNPANDIQAMARVWRDGQKKKVKIYRLLTTGTIEEKIYQRQITKQGLSGTVADASTLSKVEFSREELKDLFNLHTKTLCLTHDLLNCSCTDLAREEQANNLMDSGTTTNFVPNVTRSCQLGSIKQELKVKNLSMAELMHWSHFPRSITETDLEDELLRKCADDIDFVFRTETKGGTPF